MMTALLLALLLLVGSPAQASCAEVDNTTLDSHAGWAMTAWRADDDARFAEVWQLLVDEVACLAGSGLKTRNTDLFLVLARGALDAGDDARAVAALRALLVIEGGYQPDPALLPLDEPMAPLFAMAQVLGPDVAGFKAAFLGQEPAATAPPPPAPEPAGPTPEQLEAQQREELLAKVRYELEVDRRARKTGVRMAVVGGITCGLSLTFLVAQTAGESKPTTDELRPHRALYTKIWTGTAIGGAAVMGGGLWLARASQLDAGAMPVVGIRGRF